jgi:hypothetical protein
VVSGPAAGRSMRIERDLVIGREAADLTIADAEMSRRHAMVRPTEEGLVIEDLGSTNGTFVNGVRVARPTRLSGGSTIKVGTTEIAVESPRDAATRARPRPSPPPAAAPPAQPAAPAQGATPAGPVAPGQPAPPAQPGTPAQPPAPAPQQPAAEPAAARVQAGAPPAAPPGEAPPAEPSEAAPGAPRPRRGRVLVAAALGLVLAAGIVVAIVLATGDDTEERDVNADIRLPALVDPRSVQASGQLKGDPFGEATVIVIRQFDDPRAAPRPGGPAVPFKGNLFIQKTAGGFGLELKGTIQLTRAGDEVVRATAKTIQGGGDFEDVEGELELTGGRTNPRSFFGDYKIDGKLEY